MAAKFKVMDGNTAAAHVAYAFSEVAAIYPITPSSVMGELVDEWASKGQKNMWGMPIRVVEMQSEGGAAGAVHGSLSAGALTSTYTASQGLMLMLPVMHKIAGELLPTVFYVSARSLACQSLSIYGDHSDVMAARNTGFAMLCANSVQEVMDLSIVANLATLKSRVPFILFFDGFRTSHELQKIETVDYETMKELVDQKYIEEFRARGLNPEHPNMKVGAQNPDVYFQGREASNSYYDALPGIVQEYMDKLGAKIGRKYKLFDYVGAPDADRVIIAMGSGCETIEETINHLTAKGEKVGLLKVRLFNSFVGTEMIKALPKSVKKIAVLDRTKEPGTIGEPLYLDVVAAYNGNSSVKIIGGRYGLSSKEFTPTQVKAVYDHLNGKCTHNFTVGINDDKTKLSLPLGKRLQTEEKDVVNCQFWGLGSDGTVSANKNSIKIIGESTDKFVQGYFQYDSKKSGGITISHLRFSSKPIRSQYLLENANFIALHKASYIGMYDILGAACEGATFLLNSNWKKEEVFDHFTADMQKIIIEKKIKVYNIDGTKIAHEVGLGNRVNTVMQTAFFKLAGILPMEQSIQLIKDFTKKTFARKGDEVVAMNLKAIDQTSAAIEEVPVPAKVTKTAPDKKLIPDNADDFTKNVILPIMKFQGDVIPVSAMPDDGVIPTGTAKLEKRSIAVEVPNWNSDNCIQCTFCSFVCPHAAIRAKQIDPKDLVNKPATFNTIKSMNKNDRNLEFKIQVYPEDCTGCGSCANVCPGKKGNKALTMIPIEKSIAAGQSENRKFFETLPENVTDGTDLNTVKGSQFLMPYFEFSGACAGCGETPYLKLVSQLFGDRMIVANATGCTSIYSGTFPTTPYTKNKDGKGPAWGNSLFEDNAEYGLGMRLAVDQNRKLLLNTIETALAAGLAGEVADKLKFAKDNWTSTEPAVKANADALKVLLPKAAASASGELKVAMNRLAELKDYFIAKSVWAFGGDGWAYDIGYGGLDHVIASGENINVLVVDTEVYSNTGGQASKSTPIGAIAKFAEAGKVMSKKDLALMAMSYGYVYVATCSFGANMAQTLRAIREAESYDGPSLIICYATCIAHGTNMSTPTNNMKAAVESGHFPLFRYDPRLALEGKNPLQMDSKEPKIGFTDYLLKETRYKALQKAFPDKADDLYKKAEASDKRRLSYLTKLSELPQ